MRKFASPHQGWWPLGGLVVAVVAAYANSLGTPFVFDDIPAIVENPTIRRLAALGEVFAPQRVGGLTVAGRPILNLSFALNYAISGYEVWSYHLLNVAIHCAAALTLFGVVRRTLSLPAWRARFGGAEPQLAFFVAALWALHPLQTESVTYSVQRAESLVGLFCLLTFYCYIRFCEDRGGPWWGWAATASCALGMATKEVMVSGPVLILLYDRTFLGGTWSAAWRARGKLWLALAATWLLLGLLLFSTGDRGGTAGFGLGMSSWHYLLTQCRAIVTYLGLAAWPHPLVFDYGREVERDLIAVLPQACLLLGLLAGGVVLVWRRTPAGFLFAWFFVLLAPSSSVVPVVTQTAAEHRLYLPLAALIALAVLGLHRWIGAPRAGWWALCALLFAGLTGARNLDYRSELTLWTDTAAKYPANARAHNNLGLAVFHTGRVPDSVGHYREALRMQPDFSEAHYNLGAALALMGDATAAIIHYETAVRLAPGYLAALNNLGNALMRVDRVPEALQHYREALRHSPDFAQAHTNLGHALLRTSRAEEAVRHFQRVVELQPTSADARRALGYALERAGRAADALVHYTAWVRIAPEDPAARAALLELRRAEGEGIK